MALSWSARRKTLYTVVVGIVGLLVLWWAYETFLAVAPTCQDGVQNGNEHGVDCGGSCSLLCTDQAQAPKVLWSRVFQTDSTTYTAAAYIENDNLGAGARRVPYSFQLFDADNQLIIERDGVIDLPPIQTIPIIAVNIPLKNRVPSRALFGFSVEPAWNKIPAANLPKLSVRGQQLSADASKLTAMIQNDSNWDLRVQVAAVLFDESGTARAASVSVAPVSKHASATVVFTFPGGVPNIVRAEVTVLPPF